MIKLGSVDIGTSDSARTAYLKQVESITRLPLAEVAAGADRIALANFAPDANQSMSVATVQQHLKNIGFFPGGAVDGICGYRTQSAVRLFQEYVRSVEKIDCTPDGQFGPGSQKQLQRWLDNNVQSQWASIMAQWQTDGSGVPEYGAWLALLSDVKAKYMSAPTRALELVNSFSGANDTIKVSQWDFSSKQIHLIGIRRSELAGKFDDIFVLLIKGMVFKFQGSTEPGASSSDRGRPFLVQGQHNYHFGWHKRTYLALRPQGNGVLIVRSRNNDTLDEADLKNGLEANPTINIHWAGKGLLADVKTWSEGCQVINGSVYLNPSDTLVSCTAFAALNNENIAANPGKTRGAYNVLFDVVTALGNDLTPTVKYTLLNEADLDLAPDLKQGLANARARVVPLLG